MTSKYNVKQVRSSSGQTPRVVDTLKCLGLGRIGKIKSVPANEATKGMLKKVEHLVYVTME